MAGVIALPERPKEGTSVQRKTQRRLAWLAVPLCLSMLAAACGDDDEDADTGGDGGGGGGGGNSVNISGSSTVEPISSLVAEEFQIENEGVEVAVDGPGTGDGFELFCNGETDISDASRPIDEEEMAACQENGVEYVELQIGFDGMSVLTNPANEVECLSFADLYALIGPEATGSNWSDASALATELGSTTQLPDAPLDLTGPGQESGTYDSFIEIAITPVAEEQGLPEDQIETIRSDYSASADDNVIVENITASDSSLGWVGFAFAESAGDSVKELAISEEPAATPETCVAPSAETIADESYPLSRPLFIYVNTANATDNQAVADYVDFYLSDLNTWVEEAGYVPMPDNLVQETTSAWESR
jgi:phosphate transport system substrate-binding protein